MFQTTRPQEEVEYLFNHYSFYTAKEMASIDWAGLETELVTNYGYNPYEAYKTVKTRLAQSWEDRLRRSTFLSV